MEPALRTGRWRIDPDQLDDDCYDPDLCLSAKGDFRGDVEFLLTNGQAGQPFSLHTTEAQARTIFAIYALGLIAISAEILLLNLRAWQLREPLRLNPREQLMTHDELTGWSIPMSVGIVSLIFSFTFR